MVFALIGVWCLGVSVLGFPWCIFGVGSWSIESSILNRVGTGINAYFLIIAVSFSIVTCLTLYLAFGSTEKIVGSGFNMLVPF